MGDNEGTGAGFGEQPTTRMPPVAEPPAPAPGAPSAPPPARGRSMTPWLVAVSLIAVAALALAAFLFLQTRRAVAVPDLAGMTLARATADLEGAGLAVGRIEYEVTDASVAASGTVIGQQPPAGSSVARSTPIMLIVASGEAAAATGGSSAEATAADGGGSTGEAEPEPEPEPEPAAEDTRSAEPTAAAWHSVLAEDGRGPYMSAPFTTTVRRLKLTFVASAPSGGNITFRLWFGDDFMPIASEPLTDTDRKHVIEREIIPGVHRLSIVCPPGCGWSFKLQEYR